MSPPLEGRPQPYSTKHLLLYHIARHTVSTYLSVFSARLSLKGPVGISLIAVFLTPRAVPGTWQVLTSCLVNAKKLIPVLKKEMESNAINVVVVLEGGEFFILAVSTQGEEAPSHPAHHFPEPLTITCIKLGTS